MIINKIIMNNFFRYYGKQIIDCSINKEKNVIVIIGKNGRGKTTIINAFQWVFYGKVSLPLTIDKMLNDNRLNEMEVNQGDDAYVEVEFLEKDDIYRIRRSQHFIKDSTDVTRKKGTPVINFYKLDKNGNYVEIDINNRYTNNIIPEKLSGFFFFDGERIDRLAKVDGKHEIRQAILDTLGITSIEKSVEDLRSAHKHIFKELKKYNQGNDEKDLSNEHELNLEVRDKKLVEIKKCKIDLQKAENLIKECGEQLKKYGSDEVKKLETERERLEFEFKKRDKEITDINKSIKDHISKNFKYYLISKKSNVVEKLLEEKREKGQLPSNIKITFINDLIDKGECICGCNLKNDKLAMEKIKNLKRNAGRSELDEAYIKIKGLIDNSKNGEGKNFLDKLDKYVINRSNIIKDREDIQEDLLDIKRELDIIGDKSDNIKSFENMREKARLDRYNLVKKIGQLESDIVKLNANIDKLEKQIKLLNSNNEIVRRKTKQLEAIEQIQKLNNEFKEMFIRKVREELDNRIKEVFAQITNKDYRVPELNENFELKVINKLKACSNEEILSTGEGQITSLSFIGALVSYARDNKNLGAVSEFSGDDYPIVMDSPFGNLDESHTENVARNIGKLASQVIIIVSKKQWNGHVEENIISQVARKYTMNDGETLDSTNREYTYILEEK